MDTVIAKPAGVRSAPIRIEKISPILGAKVHGVDLSQPLDDGTFAAIHDAWMAHKVLAFPDQELDHAAYIAFASRFGEPYGPPISHEDTSRTTIVQELRADQTSTSAFGETWHSDMTSTEAPPMATMLRLVEVPPDGGGDTLFADMYALYDALSEPVKTLLDGLTAVHDSAVFAKKYGIEKALPRATHPVVRTHPVTGRKGLFVNVRFTTRINELSELESDAVLRMLFRHIAETSVFHMRFRWSKNTLLLWDNRCLQHVALFDYWPHLRLGYRLMIRGDRPA